VGIESTGPIVLFETEFGMAEQLSTRVIHALEAALASNTRRSAQLARPVAAFIFQRQLSLFKEKRVCAPEMGVST
jgi:hypothetical protein